MGYTEVGEPIECVHSGSALFRTLQMMEKPFQRGPWQLDQALNEENDWNRYSDRDYWWNLQLTKEEKKPWEFDHHPEKVLQNNLIFEALAITCT